MEKWKYRVRSEKNKGKQYWLIFHGPFALGVVFTTWHKAINAANFYAEEDYKKEKETCSKSSRKSLAERIISSGLTLE